MRIFLVGRRSGLYAAIAAVLLSGGSALAQPVIQMQANPRGSDAPAVAAPNPTSANSPIAPALPSDPSYHGGPYVGALTPPPASAMNKRYPLCSATIRDSCINPRQAGLKSGRQPLPYWPGRPASEIRERAGG